MIDEPTILLTGGEVASLLGLTECMDAVERAFRLHAEGKAAPPGILGVQASDGGFHLKAGLLDTGRSLFAAKINANFPGNRKRHSLPLIQGVLALFDAGNGRPLAVMDSVRITIIRTGAATGVAAKLLAGKEARTATIAGCGNQGRISLQALQAVRPISRVFAYDIDEGQARRFVEAMSREAGIEIGAVRDLAAAVRQSDVCVTCTPSTEPIIRREWVRPGAFIAAVGADHEEKQEIDPALMASARVVVDVLDQSATIGDLHHAIERGLMTRSAVHAELGEILAGRKPGRTSASETFVFDSTGMALQDVAAAAIVYERAVAAGVGKRVHLAA